jgi:hypothetical protein
VNFGLSVQSASGATPRELAAAAELGLEAWRNAAKCRQSR